MTENSDFWFDYDDTPLDGLSTASKISLFITFLMTAAFAVSLFGYIRLSEYVINRFTQQDLHAEHRYVPDVVQPSLQGPWPQKIAIIGGGPAGLSCAYFLATQGYKPTVFEKNERPGGMLRYFTRVPIFSPMQAS